MKGSDTDWGPDQPEAAKLRFLVENFKGVCFAAFSTVDALQRMTGCTLDQAAELQGRALNDFMLVRMEIERAKHRMNPNAART
jgi:hypothetical protein